jgi:hypothetical protein
MKIAVAAAGAALLGTSGLACGEQQNWRVPWLGAYASTPDSVTARFLYLSACESFSVDAAQVREAGVSFEVTLLSHDDRVRGPVRACRHVGCVLVELPRFTRIARLRDGTNPRRLPQIPREDLPVATTPERDCPAVPVSG